MGQHDEVAHDSRVHPLLPPQGEPAQAQLDAWYGGHHQVAGAGGGMDGGVVPIGAQVADAGVGAPYAGKGGDSLLEVQNKRRAVSRVMAELAALGVEVGRINKDSESIHIITP